MLRLWVPSEGGRQSSHNACVLHITVRCSHYPIYTRIYLCKKNSKPPTSTRTLPTHLSPLEHTRLWNGSWFHANLKSLFNLPPMQNLGRSDISLYWTTSYSSSNHLSSERYWDSTADPSITQTPPIATLTHLKTKRGLKIAIKVIHCALLQSYNNTCILLPK